jgi:hypothetical protein
MNFDLNIQKYTKSDLEEIFELSTGYDEDSLNMNELKIRKNILSNKNIDTILKPKILNFLGAAKNILLDNTMTSEALGSKIESLKNTYENVYNLDKTLKPSDTISDGGTFLIQKPHTPYGQSKPSEFYEGVINPLSTRILRKNLNIDTRFRDNYYTTVSSNFHLDLPLRFTKIVSMQLTALEFPSTFYCISKVFGNNFFVITINNTKTIITIPDGNYTTNSMASYLNTLMTSYSVDPDPNIALLQYIYFTIDIEDRSGSGKMIIGINSSYNKTDPLIFSLNFKTDRFGNEDRINPLPLKLGWLFGFREGIYINNSVYVSEGIVDLQGIRYLYLVVDDFNNNVSDGFYGAFNSSILNKNILARISLQGNAFNNISQNNLSLITSSRQYFGPVDIQKLQIQLLDEYGRILDLNNMDYSFCLTLQSIYDL